MNEEQKRTARAFVNSGALEEVFGRVAQDLTAAWLHTKESDTQGRERLWAQIQLIKQAQSVVTAEVIATRQGQVSNFNDS